MAAKTTSTSQWYQAIWLPFAAATYILICLFDFIIMPVYVTAHNSRVENVILTGLTIKDAATFADTIVKSNQAQRQWNPLTLLGAGMFHLAFGALLTGGAVTRGFAKKSEIEGYYKYGQTDSYNYDEQPDYRSNEYGRPQRRPTTRYPERTSTATDQPMPRTDDLE